MYLRSGRTPERIPTETEIKGQGGRGESAHSPLFVFFMQRNFMTTPGKKKRASAKQRLPLALIFLIFAVGIGAILYPIISNFFYEKNQSKLVTDYEEAVKDSSAAEREEQFRLAQEYNESLLGASVTLTDPFDPDALDQAGKEPYSSLLNLNGDGIMGYVEIPLIDVDLPIYHGTSGKILEKGVGHLENTSLPVGGESAHCVLTGHTGYPGKKLFTDLTSLEAGDVFYLHVLGSTLCYQVDQITVVEPEDTSLLKISYGEDRVTLLTCYPYGINTHRLLVSGSRIPYDQAVSQEQAMDRKTDSQWSIAYGKGVLICLAVYVPLTLLILKLLKKRRSRFRF